MGVWGFPLNIVVDIKISLLISRVKKQRRGPYSLSDELSEKDGARGPVEKERKKDVYFNQGGLGNLSRIPE